MRNGIGERLRHAREVSGLSQADMAKHLGVERSTYNRYERGTRQVPPTDLPLLARVLEVDPATLLGGPPTTEPRRTPQELLRMLEHTLPELVPLSNGVVGAGSRVGSGDVEYLPYSPPPQLRGHTFRAMRMVGDCLEPDLHEGQIIIYDIDGSPRADDFVVAVRDDSEYLVKILEVRRGKPYLVAHQHWRATLVDGESVKLAGVVEWAGWKPRRRRRA